MNVRPSGVFDDFGAVLAHSDQVGVIEPTTPEQVHAAALAVCHHATDLTDAAHLLDLLGLREALTDRQEIA